MANTLFTVKSVIVLDNDGHRLIARYYDDAHPTHKEQRAFEERLFQKTNRANAEITMFDGVTVVYRSNIDVFFYVVGAAYDNELILMTVLNAFFDTISTLLQNTVEKRAILDNLDGVLLALDEIIDGGIIMEIEPATVLSHIISRRSTEQKQDSVSQLFQSATEKVAKNFLK